MAAWDHIHKFKHDDRLMFFTLENKYLGKWSHNKYLHKDEFLVNKSSYSVNKRNVSIEDYAAWHKKGHSFIKDDGNEIIAKQKIYAFIAGIKDPQLKDSVAASHAQPQFGMIPTWQHSSSRRRYGASASWTLRIVICGTLQASIPVVDVVAVVEAVEAIMADSELENYGTVE